MPTESGILDLRAHFVPETVVGVTPTDPAWKRFSDTILRVASMNNANIFARRPVGTPDVAGFHGGPEDHELTVEYYLQRWFTTGGGTLQDPAAWGLLRDSDGALRGTHSALFRQSQAAGGALDAGRRVYTVVVGGRVQQVNIPGNPDSGEPVRMVLSYLAEKIRSYVIEQPLGAGSTVTVESTDAADTTQSVTIEDDGGVQSETLALDGITPVAGVASFTSIDSISLDLETKGDVIIKIGAEEICRILGQDSTGSEGDLGVPALGAGSFEGAIGTAYEQVIGDTVTRGGQELESGVAVLALEIQVQNNLEVSPRLSTRRRKLSEGSRALQVTATVFSEKGSHEALIEHLKTTEADIVWTMAGGTLTVSGAALTGLGSRVYESEQAVMRRDNTFTGKSLAIGEA